MKFSRHLYLPARVIDGYTGPQRFFLGWGQVWRRKYRDDNLRMRLAVDPHSPNQFLRSLRCAAGRQGILRSVGARAHLVIGNTGEMRS